MHRILVETDQLDSERPVLSPDARRHLKVVRPKDGEAVELFDGRGRSRVVVCRAGLVLEPAEDVRFRPRPAASLTLFACVTKGARWDWTVEKATELGATRIVPVISERTIVRLAAGEREAKRARWMRIAEEAARQSDALWLPEVCAPVDFAESVALARETACFVGALTDPPPPAIGDALAALGGGAAARPLAAFVGPEGDFAPAELAALLAVATPVSFGATILRAETAAIFALSVLKAFCERRSRNGEV